MQNFKSILTGWFDKRAICLHHVTILRRNEEDIKQKTYLFWTSYAPAPAMLFVPLRNNVLRRVTPSRDHKRLHVLSGLFLIKYPRNYENDPKTHSKIPRQVQKKYSLSTLCILNTVCQVMTAVLKHCSVYVRATFRAPVSCSPRNARVTRTVTSSRGNCPHRYWKHSIRLCRIVCFKINFWKCHHQLATKKSSLLC